MNIPPQGDERAQLSRLVSEVEIIKDQMSKVAVVLDHLTRQANTPREAGPQPVAPPDLRSTLEAMKVHVASFPNALREARRSDAATQKAIGDLAERVREIESRLAERLVSV